MDGGLRSLLSIDPLDADNLEKPSNSLSDEE